MSVTERAAIVLQQIDAELPRAEAGEWSSWPKSMRCLKTAIEGLQAAQMALPECDDTAWDTLTTLCDQWEASR